MSCQVFAYLQRIKPIWKKKCVKSECQDGVNLEGKATRGGGMFGVESRGTGGERRNVVNAEKAEDYDWKKKKIKKREYENSVAWWMRSGLADGGGNLWPALHMNFWMTMDHLYHLLVLSLTLWKRGPWHLPSSEVCG